MAVAHLLVALPVHPQALRSPCDEPQGTASGSAQLVADLVPGPMGSSPGELTLHGDAIYFRANRDELWRTRGTAATTERLLALDSYGHGWLSHLASAGQLLYFHTGDPKKASFNLWRTDGTAAGTVPIQSLDSVRNLTAWGTKLFLAADDFYHGWELWRSDGTAAGTDLLRDLNPGPEGSDPGNLVAVCGGLVLAADDGATGRELWFTAGPPGEISSLGDLHSGPGDSSPGRVTAAGDQLFFAAENEAVGRELWSLARGSLPRTDVLCLHGHRFEIDARWTDFQGHRGRGSGRALTGGSGVFTFFNDANPEILIKVLDACSLSAGFWVFDTHLSNVEHTVRVTDTRTGQTRTIFNPGGTIAPPVLGTRTIFTECSSAFGMGLPRTEVIDTGTLPPVGDPIIAENIDLGVIGPCQADATTLCLHGGRFRIRADYRANDGILRPARQWSLSSDSGYSTFFSDANVELLIKVLDACSFDGSWWVFAGGLTDIAVEVFVEDTVTGATWQASNPAGRPFATTLDTDTPFTDCGAGATP